MDQNDVKLLPPEFAAEKEAIEALRSAGFLAEVTEIDYHSGEEAG